MRRQRAVAFGLFVAAIPLLAGCGNTADQDLCGNYADLATAVDGVRAIQPRSATVDDLRAKLDTVQAELDQLQAVSEGRLDTAISNLRAAIDGFKQAAVNAGDKARATAVPLLEESLGDVAEAYGALKMSLDTQCNGA